MNELGEFTVDTAPTMMKLRSKERPWQLDVIERLVDSGALLTCSVCFKPFVSRNRKQRYCSFRCKQEANRYRARQRKRRMRGAI